MNSELACPTPQWENGLLVFIKRLRQKLGNSNSEVRVTSTHKVNNAHTGLFTILTHCGQSFQEY